MVAANARRGLLLARAAPAPASRSRKSNSRSPGPTTTSSASCRRVGGHDGSARVGITRTVYPTTDRETAIKHLEAGTRQWSQEMVPGLYPASISCGGVFREAQHLRRRTEEVTEQLSADRAVRLATDLLIQVPPGLPTFGQTVTALETIATEIAPALGWRPSPRR